MRRLPICLLVVPLLLAPLGLAEEPAAAGSDLVLVVDLSSSMRKNDALSRARQLLQGLIERVVQPGSQVALVPFGAGVHEIERFDAAGDEGGAAEARARIREALDGLKARDSYSYVGAALDAGLEIMKEMKTRRPDRSRHLVLVTDGPQTVASGDPAPALVDVISAWEERGLKASSDWFLWYAYFNDPDGSLASLIERGGCGRAVPLDRLDELTWTFTHVESKKQDLGAKGGTSWTARVPFVARSGGSAAGRRLRLSIGGQMPDGMKVTVSPREMVLVGRSTEIELQLICTGAQSGAYDGLVVLVEGEGTLHWAEPRRLPLRFRVGEPRLTVKQPRLDLGRVAPGASTSGKIVLVPNADAAISPAKVKFAVTTAPAGVKFDPAAAEAAEGEMALGFTLTIPGDAKEGTAECKLKLDAGDTALSAPEVRVVFQVAPPRVAVSGALKLEAATGEDATGELSLAPDAAAASIAPEVRATAKKGLPAGVTVETPAVVAKDKAAMAVRVRVAGDVAAGEYRTAITFSAPGVRVEPVEVPLVVRVVRPPEPPQLDLPASLDLGDVPKVHAAELVGRFPVELPPGFDGTDLVLESGGSAQVVSEPTLLAEGKNEVVFRLAPASLEPGEQVEFVRVLARRARRAREAGMIALRWRITDGQLAVKEVKKPEPLPYRGGTAEAALAIDASEDLKGKALSLKLAFEQLPEGMQATLLTEKAEVAGGVQAVPVQIEIGGGKPGSYRGKIEIALDTGLVLATAQIPVVIRPLDVAVVLEGSLEGLSPDDDRAVALVVTVEDALVQAIDLSVKIDRAGLPDGVSIQTLETATLRRAGNVRVPVKFRVTPGAEAGTWHPRVSLAAEEGVVIEPSTVDLTVVVPRSEVVAASVVQPTDSQTSLWGVLGLAALACTALAALYVGRSKDDLLIEAQA